MKLLMNLIRRNKFTKIEVAAGTLPDFDESKFSADLIEFGRWFKILAPSYGIHRKT